jgi:hypothetical protein
MSETAAPTCHTEHALLVLLGQYAQHLGLIKALMAVPLHQQTRTFSPQTKVLEFLVAILAGLPHLEDISRDGRPLDQDQAVAQAWQQAGWADYSGVARTLQVLSQAEAEAIAQVLAGISRPLLDQQVTQALAEHDRLEYDGDLTGRPVSNTSTTYPGATFGHMDDDVRLGYQAAVVSFGSPTYRRLWLSVKPHPGHLLSCQLTEELVQAAEAHTRVRPRRRTELLGQRLQAVSEQLAKTTQGLAQRQQRLAEIQTEIPVCYECWQGTEHVVAELAADFQACGRAEKPHSTLAKARRRARHWQRRYERQTLAVGRTRKLIQRQQLEVVSGQAQVAQLQARLRRFESENASNIAPVQAVFRLDAGFAPWDNVALLIELGYEVYSRPYNQKIKAALLRRTGAATAWTRVGDNAEMIAWPDQQLKGCPYPVDIAFERFYTGKTLRYGVLLHFGTDRVTADLPAWFAYYNARQTIEAGIKEGKGVFQMHHLKVRRAPALWLQEQFAAFAANFVRWAARWLSTQCYQEPQQWLQPVAASVKTLVQVAAHTPATVEWLPDGCLLRFTDESLYAGRAIQTGGCAFQLSLPIFQNVDSDPISTNRALIAQSLR